jgi:hypothetical protein
MGLNLVGVVIPARAVIRERLEGIAAVRAGYAELVGDGVG